MRFITALLCSSLAQAAFGAVIAAPEKRAVAYGFSGGSVKSSRGSLARRGEEYNMDRLDDLEEEAEDASKEQIYQSIDYLANIFNQKGVGYGLMGGVAMQLYGYEDRETKDSDMTINVNSRDLLDKIKDDQAIARPPPLMAASGTARLFVKIGDQQVASDVFVQGGDQSPPVETHQINGYWVLNLAPLINSKLRRAEDKDNEDVLWLIQNKGSDVNAQADAIDQGRRIEFTKTFIEDDDEEEGEENDNLKLVRETFKLSKEQIWDD
ncbi:hypothetical protein F4777DRAFT_484793 [Nemania sp. FL0916]|nr:hypothetical protein F4777DRAFT_484793 [Nemania sp. FL0916]